MYLEIPVRRKRRVTNKLSNSTHIHDSCTSTTMTCRVIHKLQMTFRQDVNKFLPRVTTLNKAKALSSNVRASTIQKTKQK
ncbi:hypothetical protein V6Z11_D13G054300 [Gossypium hirsutum]